MSDLQTILAALPNRPRVLRDLAAHRDRAEAYNETAWARLWAYLWLELASLTDAGSTIRTHDLTDIPREPDDVG
ncbi:hypothetical protein PROP_03143 [Propionicimonas sp. T2.31MG-18]|uniref:hypothetical protein n=1 Tax=Propionicimonas sp. T2.31MG-18 TaxID=3157620 RepID=UPI0035EE9FB4